jgi:hypothetical protein
MAKDSENQAPKFLPWIKSNLDDLGMQCPKNESNYAITHYGVFGQSLVLSYFAIC